MNYHHQSATGPAILSISLKISIVLFLVFLSGIFFPCYSQGHPATDDEFVGPFPSWINVKTQYGAVGDGIADETAAIQAAFNAIGNANSTASVIYFPAGTYRITGTLTMNYKMNVSVIGTDPVTTKIIWGGANGGTMMQIDGTAYARFNRLTWDGNSIASIAIDQSWNGTTGYFDTGNEFADDVFVNVGIGIRGGYLGHGFAETSIMRCRFSSNMVAGISLGNFNALDVWVWHSIFENCSVGITNNNTTSSAGNFKVYNSIFRNSTTSDIVIGNTGEFSFRDNTSTNSQMFLKVSSKQYPANITLQSNTIIDPVASTAIEVRDQGPLVLIDNIIRSRTGATSPVIFHSTTTSSELVSMGNTFTIANAIFTNGRNIIYDNAVISASSLNHLAEQALPGTQPNLNRTVLEVPPGASTSSIQAIINQAALLTGIRPVVHFPHGTYNITSTLTIPSGSDMQIVGDGHGDVYPTVLLWAGSTNGPVVNIFGPSKVTLRDIAINGNNIANGILMTNIDQNGARIFMHETEIHQNQNNLLVNGLDYTQVLAYNSRFSYSTGTSVKIVGGSLAANGNPQQGKTIVYGGLSWGNNLSYELINGANLMIRDAWYESSQVGPYVNLSGPGKFTLEGSHVSAPTTTVSPAISLSNYSGKATLLNTFIWDTVAISGNGSQTNFLGLGVQFGDYTSSVLPATTSYINNTSSVGGDIRSLNCRANNNPNLTFPRSGSYAVNNLGVADSSFIASMIGSARSIHAQVLTPLSPGITDVRFYRVWLNKTITGLDIEGNGTVLPVKFTAVNSECRNGNINITWTVQENAIKKFDVERNDNNTWNVISSINPATNSVNERTYSYDDRTNSSNSIYRIVAYDVNGAKIMSNVVQPSCLFANDNFMIYPNPVNASTIVSIIAEGSGTIELSLYDNTGVLIKRTQANLLRGKNRIPVDISGLSRGSYTLKAVWGKNVKADKLIKVE